MNSNRDSNRTAELSTWRTAPTTGILNFRDFGGYRTPAGRIKSGALYRSADHSLATPSDLTIVDALGLRWVADLRSEAERARAPCAKPLSTQVIANIRDSAHQVAPHIAAAAPLLEPQAAREEMCRRYRDFPFRPGLQDVWRQAIFALADGEAPGLVFCTAGKDRTGTFVALLHTLLGVHPDDVQSDYLLTNTMGQSAERERTLREEILKKFGPVSDEAVKVLAGVEAAFLASAFDAIAQQCGSVSNYLETVLGVSLERRAMIEGSLLE